MGALDDLAKEYGVGAAPQKSVASSLPEGFDLDTEARKAASNAGVPYGLFRGLIKQESSDKHTALSPKGAIGYTQLMPETAKGLGVDPHDPYQNLQGGAQYLRQQLDTFGNDPAKAAAAYNAGPGAVQKYNGIPPFSETQAYVPKVLGFAKDFEDKQATATPDATLEEMLSRYKVEAQPQGPMESMPKGLSKETDTSYGNKAIAAARGAADTVGLAFVGRKLAKSKTLQKANEAIRRFFGDKRSFEEVARKAQGQTKEIVAANPYSNALGKVAGAVLPISPISKVNSAIGGAKSLGVISKIILSGAATGGLSTALSDPNAKTSDIAKDAAIGGATALPLAGAGKILSYLGRNSLDRLVNSKGAGKFIMEKFGFTKTLEALEQKNQGLLTENSNKLTNALRENPTELVPLPRMANGKNPIYVKDIKDLASKYAGAKDLQTSGRLFAIAKAAKLNKMALTKEDATFLKQVLQENSRTQGGEVASGIAPKVLDEWRYELRKGVEEAAGPVRGKIIHAINKDVGTGADISRAAKAIIKAPNKAWDYRHPVDSLPVPILRGTGVAALGESVSPALAQILSLLAPEVIRPRKGQ